MEQLEADLFPNHATLPLPGTLKGRARSPVHEFMPEIILKMARVFSVVLVRQSGMNSGGDVTSARNTRVQTRG